MTTSRSLVMRSVAALALLLLTALSACRASEDASPRVPAMRVGEFVDLADWQEVTSDLLPSAQAGAIRGEDGASRKLSLTTSNDGTAVLEWPVSFDPATAFEWRLAFETDGPMTLRLMWQAEGAPDFDPAQRLDFTATGPGRQDVRRTMRGEAGLGGRIEALRLRLEAPPGRRVELDHVQALGWDPTLSNRDLATTRRVRPDADSTLYSVRFGSEVRPARLLDPASSYETPIPPGRWRLRGAAVHPSPSTARVTFVLQEEGGAPRRIPFEVPSVVPDPRHGGIFWHPLEIDVDVPRGATARYVVDWTSPEADPAAFVVLSPMRPTPRAAEGRGKRVVLVSLDTVRRDVLGAYGAEGDPTPRIDALGGRGQIFERAYSTSSWTLPAQLSLLTGYWPARHAVEEDQRAYPSGGYTLAGALRSVGFWTEAWTEGGFVDPRFGFAHGFDRYVTMPSHHRMAESVEGAVAAFEGLEGDGFLFFHTYQAHAPYAPDPDRYRLAAGISPSGSLPTATETWAWMESWRKDHHRLPIAQRELLWHAYRAGLTPIDTHVGTLLDGLDVPRAGTDDLVVVTSDHGEAFQERSDHLEHGWFLQPELLAVPLIVASGREKAAGRSGALASIADVPATILSLLGEAPPPSDGRALLGPASGDDDPARRLAAGVQPPFDAEYRVGAIDLEGIAALDLSTGETRRYGPSPLDEVSTEPPATADASALRSAWRSAQSGRTEFAFRFEGDRGRGVLRLESTARIEDVVVVPQIVGSFRIEGERALVFELDGAPPTSWLRILVETSAADSGWRIEADETLGALGLRCGPAALPVEAEACHTALASTEDLEPKGDRSLGTVVVRRHAGSGFAPARRGVGVAGGGAHGPQAGATLRRQLAALGYGDERAGEREIGALSPVRVGSPPGAPAEPSKVVLIRRPSSAPPQRDLD